MARVKPLVSVVIPVRNGIAWIGETLASVAKQTLASDCFELIVVDDGSTDGTVVFCRDFLVSRNLAWTILTNDRRGVSAARNTGIATARADWIQLLDADDLIHETKLETQLPFARDVDASVAIIASPWTRFAFNDSGGICSGTLYKPAFEAWPTLTLLRADGFLQVGSYLLRKTWWTSVAGFDEQRTHVEDVEFLLRISDAGGVFVATPGELPLFFYRVHIDSASHRDTKKIVEGSIRNALAVQSRARTSLRLDSQLKGLLLDVYSQGLRFWFANDRQRFWSLYQHVLELEPAYCPPGPRLLSLFSRLFGYPAAERIALIYRRLKSMAPL